MIVTVDKNYEHLDQFHLLQKEQKGWRRTSRGTNDLLYIDKVTIREVQSKKDNLAMTWRDYKKAYDMVPHLGMVGLLDMIGVADNIRISLIISIEKWRVDIRRGNFQGNLLSPLVFVLDFDSIRFDYKKEQSKLQIPRM